VYGNTPLHVAAAHGLHGTIAALAAAGSSVSVLSRSGASVLSAATTLVTLQQLLALFPAADVNAQCPHTQNTVLHRAALRDSADSALVLLKHGASMSLRNFDERTAEELAMEHGGAVARLFLRWVRAGSPMRVRTPLVTRCLCAEV
jgi:ankyrin repeat protein